MCNADIRVAFGTAVNIGFLGWVVVFHLHNLLTVRTDYPQNIFQFLILDKLADELFWDHR
jgi:hypothetical protein